MTRKSAATEAGTLARRQRLAGHPVRTAQQRGDEIEHGPVGVAHAGHAVAQVDLRRERLGPVEPDGSGRHRLGLDVQIERRFGPAGQHAEVALGQRQDLIHRHVAHQHQGRVVGDEVVVVDAVRRVPGEVPEVPDVPAVGDEDRVDLGGDAVDGLVEAGLRPALAPEDLLHDGEALRLPAPLDRVDQAVRLEPEEEFQVLLRERHVHLHVVLLGAGGHRVGVTHVAAALHVPLVGGPEVAVLVVHVLELVEPLPEGLHLGRHRPVELVVEDGPLPEPVALAVAERDELLLGVVDLLQDGQLGGQVAGADGGRPLVDDVLEEVDDAVLPHRFDHGADAHPQVGGHPRPAVVLGQQDREAVVELVLLDLERATGLGRGERRQGGDRAGEDEVSHWLSGSQSRRLSHGPLFANFCQRRYCRRVSTMNISLPAPLRSFVDEQVANRGFGTSSAYVRELIRRDQDRQHLRSLLLAGGESAPSITADTTYFQNLRARVRPPSTT